MGESSVIKKLDTPLRNIPRTIRSRFFLPAVILLVLLGGVLFLQKQVAMRERREACLLEAANRLAAKAYFRKELLNRLALSIQGFARMAANFPTVRGLLWEASSTGMLPRTSQEEALEHLGQVLDGVLESQRLPSVLLLDRQGALFLRRDREARPPIPEIPLDELVRQAAEAPKGEAAWKVHRDGPFLLCAIAVPARSPSDPPAGFVVVMAGPEEIRSALLPLTFEEFPGEEVLLALHEGGRLVPLVAPGTVDAPTSSDDLWESPEHDPPLSHFPGVEICHGEDHRGVSRYGAIAKVPSLPVSVITRTTKDRVFLSATEETGHFFGIVGLTVVLLVLFFLMLTRHLRSRYLQHLLEVENRYRVLAEQARDIILAISSDGKVLEANKAALMAYGYPHNVLIGMSLEQLHPPDRADSVREHLLQALEDGVFYETIHQRADGSRFPVEVSARPVRRAGRVEVVAIIRDISERKRRELQTQISQRMEVLGQLAGGVAHDFNNLLTAIRGFASMVLETLSPADNRYEYLEEVVQAADRAVELTSKLLAFSRGQALERRVVDLNRIVRGMETLFRRLVREDISLETDLSPSPLWVRADPRQIETLLMNLVVNASDAMSKGGRLVIRSRTSEATEHSPAQRPSCILSVEDTGIGMSEEVRAHAFEPFFTTKTNGLGTGLGLATVYGIVQQHEGRVWIESEPGAGTRVFVEIPMTSPTPSEEIRAVGNGEGRLTGGTETILLVEDHPDVRSYVRTVLESFGYRVLVSSNSREAMEWLRNPSVERVDLLISDVVMPGGNGIDLWEQARSLLPGLPVLFISGYAERSMFHTDALPKNVPLLQKPFRAPDLARRVREILDRNIQKPDPGQTSPQ